jgi:hypothetical protein
MLLNKINKIYREREFYQHQDHKCVIDVRDLCSTDSIKVFQPSHINEETSEEKELKSVLLRIFSCDYNSLLWHRYKDVEAFESLTNKIMPVDLAYSNRSVITLITNQDKVAHALYVINGLDRNFRVTTDNIFLRIDNSTGIQAKKERLDKIGVCKKIMQKHFKGKIGQIEEIYELTDQVVFVIQNDQKEVQYFGVNKSNHHIEVLTPPSWHRIPVYDLKMSLLAYSKLSNVLSNLWGMLKSPFIFIYHLVNFLLGKNKGGETVICKFEFPEPLPLYKDSTGKPTNTTTPNVMNHSSTDRSPPKPKRNIDRQL